MQKWKKTEREWFKEFKSLLTQPAIPALYCGLDEVDVDDLGGYFLVTLKWTIELDPPYEVLPFERQEVRLLHTFEHPYSTTIHPKYTVFELNKEIQVAMNLLVDRSHKMQIPTYSWKKFEEEVGWKKEHVEINYSTGPSLNEVRDRRWKEEEEKQKKKNTKYVYIKNIQALYVNG